PDLLECDSILGEVTGFARIDNNVCLQNQTAPDRLPAFALQVEGYAALVLVEVDKKGAVACGSIAVRDRGTVSSRRVSTLREVLDLDDVRAEVGQQAGAVRARNPRSDLKHSHATKRVYVHMTSLSTLPLASKSTSGSTG